MPQIRNLEEPLVSICCLTFNHAPYLRQALDGFLAQRTNFPVEIIVHDDVSSDGTREIIQEYAALHPDRIRPILQEKNIWSQGLSGLDHYMYPSAKGRYFALCEGDDFWIDPLKLQKQVDYMESHPECGLVHTDYDLLAADDHPFRSADAEVRKRRKTGNVFVDLLFWNFISTPTILVRGDLIRECARSITGRVSERIDIWYWLEIAKQHEIAFLPDTTATYRVHAGGMSQIRAFMNKAFIHILGDHLLHSLTKAHLKGRSRAELDQIGQLFVEQARSPDITRSAKWKCLWKASNVLPLMVNLRTALNWFWYKINKTLFPGGTA